MSANHDGVEKLGSGSKGLKRILRAAVYSAAGLSQAAKHEAAFRQELVLGLLLLPLSCFLPLGLLFKLFLNVIWLAVLAVELLNTAIEAVVDLVSPGYHPLAKQAKDLGSAAVFCLLLAWVAAWACALCQLLG